MPALALQTPPAAPPQVKSNIHFMYLTCEKCGKQHFNTLGGEYYDLCEDCNREALNAIGDTQ